MTSMTICKDLTYRMYRNVWSKSKQLPPIKSHRIHSLESELPVNCSLPSCGVAAQVALLWSLPSWRLPGCLVPLVWLALPHRDHILLNWFWHYRHYQYLTDGVLHIFSTLFQTSRIFNCVPSLELSFADPWSTFDSFWIPPQPEVDIMLWVRSTYQSIPL